MLTFILISRKNFEGSNNQCTLVESQNLTEFLQNNRGSKIHEVFFDFLYVKVLTKSQLTLFTNNMVVEIKLASNFFRTYHKFVPIQQMDDYKLLISCQWFRLLLFLSCLYSSIEASGLNSHFIADSQVPTISPQIYVRNHFTFWNVRKCRIFVSFSPFVCLLLNWDNIKHWKVVPDLRAILFQKKPKWAL